MIPEVPGFAGNVQEVEAIQTIMGAQYRTINRGGQSIYEELRAQGIEPYVSVGKASLDDLLMPHLLTASPNRATRPEANVGSPLTSFIAHFKGFFIA